MKSEIDVGPDLKNVKWRITATGIASRSYEPGNETSGSEQCEKFD
jgi:hypothetical protein